MFPINVRRTLWQKDLRINSHLQSSAVCSAPTKIRAIRVIRGLEIRVNPCESVVEKVFSFFVLFLRLSPWFPVFSVVRIFLVAASPRCGLCGRNGFSLRLCREKILRR